MFNNGRFCLHIVFFLILFPFPQGMGQESTRTNANESLKYMILAREHYTSGEKALTESHFKDFFSQVFLHPRKYPADDWADSCYQLAISIYRGKDYELLAEVLDPLIENDPLVNDNLYYGELGKIINILALAYKNLGFVSESIPIYLRALEYLKLCNSLPARTLPEFYINIGNAMRSLGDLSLSENYYQQALRELNKLLLNSNLDSKTRNLYLDRKSTTLNSIGLSYRSLGKFQQALDSFTESMAIAKSIDSESLPRLHNNIGLSYSDLDNIERAAYHYLQAISAYNDLEKDNSWVLYMLNYTGLLMETDTANNENLKNSLELILTMGPEIQGITSRQMANADLQMGQFLSKKDFFEEAIKNYDKGLSRLTGIDLRVTPFPRVPSIELDNSPDKIIEVIKFRARLFFDWGEKTKDSSKYFLALENYELAEVCIDSLRSTLEGEESKINLSRMARETYSEKLELLWKLYSIKPDPMLAKKAFQTIENGKGSSIWNLIQLSETKSLSLPPNIVKEEKSLKQEIASYSNNILSLELSGSYGAGTLDSLKNLRFNLESRLDSLTNYINVNFADYKEEKFQNKIYGTGEVQQMLGGDKVMIQYYFSDNYLHQILLSHESIRYEVCPNPDSIRQELKKFNSMLQLSKYDYSKKDVEEYHAMAWGLYKILIKPFEDEIYKKEIILLPDDYLSFIPFEPLVSSDGLLKDSDFRHLKYLLHTNEVSYSYNASLWAFIRTDASSAKKLIFALAPSYNLKELNTNSVWKNWQHMLPELPGTIQEINMLRSNYRAKTLSNSKATEQKFKEIASEYKILHLAMHSLVDEESPENSFLVFSPLADKNEDGRLYPNEIRNLDLNSPLTILSACNSGRGELASGEGVLSLSRMFILGGASSVIMTLWSVDDQTSMELISKLYHEMAYEMSVSEALRSSKINFLATAGKLHAHPYFWSGFIQLGRDTKININNNKTLWPWLAGGAFICALLLLGLLKKNTKSRL